MTKTTQSAEEGTTTYAVPRCQPLCIPHFNKHVEAFYQGNADASRATLREAELALAVDLARQKQQAPQPSPRRQPGRIAKLHHNCIPPGGRASSSPLATPRKAAAVLAVPPSHEKSTRANPKKQLVLPLTDVVRTKEPRVTAAMERKVARIRAKAAIPCDEHGNLMGWEDYRDTVLATVQGFVVVALAKKAKVKRLEKEKADRKKERQAKKKRKVKKGDVATGADPATTTDPEAQSGDEEDVPQVMEECIYGSRPWACVDCLRELDEAAGDKGRIAALELMMADTGWPSIAAMEEDRKRKRTKTAVPEAPMVADDGTEVRSEIVVQFDWEGRVSARKAHKLGRLRFVLDTCRQTMLMFV